MFRKQRSLRAAVCHVFKITVLIILIIVHRNSEHAEVPKFFPCGFYGTWAENVARMGEKRNAYRLLVGKTEGKRPLGRPRRRWVDNIRMDVVELELGDVDWIGLAENRDRWRALVNSVFNLGVP
jgi:hypothetical protein